MEARVVSGEFEGSARRAANDPECIALGVDYRNIEYHISLINPADRLARAADRARVETETAAAAAGLHGCFFYRPIIFTSNAAGRPR